MGRDGRRAHGGGDRTPWEARRAWYATPPGIRLAPFVAAAMLPFITNSEYIVRISLDTLVFVLLCLGLNITAGWAGLLDLGYIAFFGFGAYMYAFLASDHFDIHWPTIVVLPIATAATVALGFLLGLPSRRLTGDYLAIVTLFFAQIFVLLTLNGNRIAPPGKRPAHRRHRRPERDHRPRSVRVPRRHVRRLRELLLVHAPCGGRRRGHALVRQRLANRPCLAVGARGRARRQGP